MARQRQKFTESLTLLSAKGTVLTPSSSLPRALTRLSAKSPLCRASAYAESYTLDKDLFAESICSPRVTVGKFRVCREPDRMLSANFKSLGKSSVSRSDGPLNLSFFPRLKFLLLHSSIFLTRSK